MPRSDTQPSPPTAGVELECPRCGTVAVNSDFCACGEYLAWELKLAAPDEDAPAPEPPAYRPPEPAAPRASTLLTLRDPARDDAPDAAVSVPVVPGAEVTVLATIRNQGEIVDTFDLRVDGLPAGWTTVSPATVFLNPWGTAGDYQLDLQVRLHPPRAPASEARAWPLQVVARSRSLGVDVASAEATLIVQPFLDTIMTVGPERRRGRRHGSFDVAVANHGNGPVEVAVGARDTEQRCPISIGPALMTVPVGASAAAIVIVDVPRPLVFGRSVDHHVEVTHRVSGVESDPKPQRVTFQQRPWLPWWMPPAARSAGGVHHRPADAVPPPRGSGPHGAHRRECDQAAQAARPRDRSHDVRDRAEGRISGLDHPPGARSGRGGRARPRGHRPRRPAEDRARPVGGRAHAGPGDGSALRRALREQPATVQRGG